MSAYIVDDACIHRIITHLNRHASNFDWITRPFGYDLSQTDDLQRLASDLYLMNCDAVDNRYGHGTAAQDDATRNTEFQFQFTMPDAPIAVYKAVRCLRYQCAEGDVPLRPLFKMLDSIGSELAHAIVRKMPEYNNAPWGQ